MCWSKRYSVWPLRAYWLIAVVWPRSFRAYRLITAAALYTTGVAPVGGLLDCPRSIVSIGPVSVVAEAVGTQNQNSALPLSLSYSAVPYRWVQSFCRLSLLLSRSTVLLHVIAIALTEPVRYLELSVTYCYR